MPDKTSVDQFLEFFPLVELPVTVTEDSIVVFDSRNDVLPKAGIEQFIISWEGGQEIDEYTEFVPCFRLPDTSEDYHAIVYWKGGLLKYEYLLVTFDKKEGKLINRKSIAGTIAEGSLIKKSVAQIDEDLIIHIMAGVGADNDQYDPESSQAFNMEIMSTGEIVFSLGEGFPD